jgi:galactose mutarotase-like enzyme
MSAIAIQQKQYKTYVLSTDSARLEVVPERGGVITSWQVKDTEILYLDTERFTDPSLSVRGGVPLLFPICGNLPNDTYSLQGQTYTLKQHGFVRNMAWEVSDQATEADHASLTLSLKGNEETLASYPFAFELTHIYTLRDNTLEMTFRHTNHSERAMPFSTGIHPYFAVSDKSMLRITLPSHEYKIKGGSEVYAFSGSFDFTQEEIDFAFINLKGQTASVNDLSRNLTLNVTYDKSYSTLVFWAVKGKDFYCLEPWTGPRNAINTGEDLLRVAPGETVETHIRFGIAPSA